jgi:hypothetical protein
MNTDLTSQHEFITNMKLENRNFKRFEGFLEQVKKETYPEKESGIHSTITARCWMWSGSGVRVFQKGEIQCCRNYIK